MVTLALRTDLQALLTLSSLRSTGTRPPERIPETRQRATGEVRRLLKGTAHATNNAIVAWVVEYLLFAEEPLSLRREARVVDEGAAVFVGETARQELLDALRPRF